MQNKGSFIKKQNIDKTVLKQTFLGFSLALVVMFIVITGFLFFQAINYNGAGMPLLQDGSQDLKQEKNIQNQNTAAPAEILAVIDRYQARYFEIIKRNDMFLKSVDYDGYERDRRVLSDLYAEVISKINTNNIYFKKYEEIEKQFAENTGETTYDINMFANNHYEAVDKLLNEAYQDIKTKISAEDFKNLTSSELKWIKEVEGYEKVFEAQGYGSIGTSKYLGYKTDMQRFRTLLLMLYL